MNKSNRKVFIISSVFIIIAFIVLCVCCKGIYAYRHNDPALENVDDWQIMGMNGHPLGTSPKVVKVLEKDEYGRVLFKTFNTTLSYHMEGASVTAYVICQAMDGETGYCLPDICYELTNMKDALPKDRMADLKTRNGWNTEPDKSQYVACNKFFYEKTDENKIRLSVSNAAGLDIDEIRFETRYMETDGAGRKLYGIVFNSANDGGIVHRYLVVFDKNYKCINYKEFDSFLELAKLKTEIKESVGWEQLNILG